MIVHNLDNLPTIPIADLLPTQGELKDLSEKNYAKLKNNIERRGFIDAVAVWEDEKGLLHLLDGHQRQRVLIKEDWSNPIPYRRIPAKNLQEAAAIVLEITSQYGTVTQEGLDAHIARYDLPEIEIYEATHFDATPYYADANQLQQVNKGEEAQEWAQLDDFEAADKSLKLVIQFETEEDRIQFEIESGIKIRQKGKQTWSTWYPYKERNDFSDVKIQ